MLDSNSLLRVFETGHVHQLLAIHAMEVLENAGHELVWVPQVGFEVWSVSSRPKDQNGLGFTVGAAINMIRQIESELTFLNDKPILFDNWYQLVTRYGVTGRNAYDARLAAAMLTHGVTHLLTFNTPDFARFPNVVCVDPASPTLPL